MDLKRIPLNIRLTLMTAVRAQRDEAVEHLEKSFALQDRAPDTDGYNLKPMLIAFWQKRIDEADEAIAFLEA